MTGFGSARKDTSTKVKEAVEPDIMKSDAKQVKEATTGTADRTARDAMPDSSKSIGQKTTDKFERAKDSTTPGSQTHGNFGDKVKQALKMDKTQHTTTHTSSTGTGTRHI